MGDFFELVALDDVAFLVLVEIAQPNTALEALADLVDIFLEPLEGDHAAVVNRLLLADDAGAAALGDPAALDLGAGDHEFGELEHLFDERGAQRGFAQLGIQHAGHGFLHLVHQLVNDAEQLDLDALTLGGVGRGVVGLGVEADDHGAGGLGEEDVGFGNRANGGEDDIEVDLLALDLPEGFGDGLDGALHIPLENDLQALLLSLGDTGKKAKQPASHERGTKLRRMKLRAWFKGKKLRAQLLKGGRVRFAGKVYDSLSTAAAKACKRRTCNGWTFWKYQRAPGDWVTVDHLRK